jgi:hypothetical protein
VKDDEGEWLNCVWHRENGEAMSKQVQRYSTDVRPPEGQNAIKVAKMGGKRKASVSGHKTLQDEIKQRMNGFQRKAPYFSRTLRSSTFSRPASGTYRRSKRLTDITETLEEHRSKIDEDGDSGDESVRARESVMSWSSKQTTEWVLGLGDAFKRYRSRFKGMKGSKLLALLEEDGDADEALRKLGISAKLHRAKLLFELQRITDPDFARRVDAVDVLNWTPARVKLWLYKQSMLNLYCTMFLNNGINGALLFELDLADLETIGVREMHRKRVLSTINNFHESTFPDSVSSAASREDESKEEEALSSRASSLEGDDARSSMSPVLVGASGGSGGGGGGVSKAFVAASLQLNGQVIDLLADLTNLVKSIAAESSVTMTVRSDEIDGKVDEARQRFLHLRRQFNKHGGGSLEDMDDLSDDMSRMSLSSSATASVKASAKDPMIEGVVGMGDVGGLSGSAEWVSTLEQKKGHKRRASVSGDITDLKMLVDGDDDEDDEDMSDLE